MLHHVRNRLHRAPCVAARPHPAPLARIQHQKVAAALLTARPRKTVRQNTALQIFPQVTLYVTSVDRKGTRRGFDLELVSLVTKSVGIPVIASSGMGSTAHLIEVVKGAGAVAVAVADMLHYNRSTFLQIRQEAFRAVIVVRGSTEWQHP